MIQLADRLARFDEKIAQLIHLKAQYTLAVEKLDSLLPSLKAALKKSGLEITELSYFKTGTKDEIWGDGDSLKVNFTASPLTPTSFLFLADRGYTARGAGRNQDALNAKAQKLQEQIADAIKFACRVNPFSLEANKNSENRVLAEFWLTL